MMLPVYVKEAIERLEQKGYEAFAVGGAVRDSLLGKEPIDWDIATSALPKDIIKVFGEKSCIPTGIKHGTVTVLLSGEALEITTYRIDGEYRDSRHPESVAFSSSIIDDLSRRDFTINAMAYSPSAGILDLFGGESDLKSGLVRAVGVADRRFSEDALRIMRGLRFSAVLGFDIEKETDRAIHHGRELLRNIAKERIQAELSRLVMADRPQNILTNYSDVFAVIFDGICTDFCEDVWNENAAGLCGVSASLPLRLAVLLRGVSASVLPQQMLRYLKYDNKTIADTKTILSYIDKEISPDSVCLKHILSRIDADMLRLVLEARRVRYSEDTSAALELMEEILKTGQCFRLKDLCIDGNDLMELGISGTQIGRVLKFLLNEVIEERCKNEKSALLELAKK